MNDKHTEAIELADRGEWDAAHRIVQQLEDVPAYWIHANLHREEGDLANANYWYRRAGKPCPAADVSFTDERAVIRTAMSKD